MANRLTALGLMSGTSMDGIDVGLIRTDGEDVLERGAFVSLPYDAGFRARLAGCLKEAVAMRERAERPGTCAAVEAELTARHGQAVRTFLAAQGLDAGAIDVIGFHGHTILHRPSAGLTVQIGDGAALARDTGIAVVADLRGADMAVGGQGAPLAPVYHRALARLSGLGAAVFVNIGGVANVTLCDGDTLLAFDTGPGNALLDDWALRHTGEPWDRDGRLAAKGHAHKELLGRLLEQPYFALPPPKSADRNGFAADFLEHLSPEDGAATLVHFTAATVARAMEAFPAGLRHAALTWIACGGGRRNPVLMAALGEELARRGQTLVAIDTLGLNGDSVEAEAFAYMAVRSLKGLPITFPGTTGVAAPLQGGVMFGV